MLDFAILGSSSGHYGWKYTKFCDFDIWLYCDNLNDVTTYQWIKALITKVKKVILDKFDLIFEAKAINGPYKPDIWEINRQDVLFLHILLDDKDTYKYRSIFTQLSWSKYKPYFCQELLKNLLIKVPESEDLISSSCGILKTLEVIKNRYIYYNQIDLNTGAVEKVYFLSNTTQYIEFLLHSVMMISRNRARTENREEANFLNNLDFGVWYKKEYGDSFILDISIYKEQISNKGYSCISNLNTIESLVCKWLTELKVEIMKRGFV